MIDTRISCPPRDLRAVNTHRAIVFVGFVLILISVWKHNVHIDGVFARIAKSIGRANAAKLFILSLRVAFALVVDVKIEIFLVNDNGAILHCDDRARRINAFKIALRRVCVGNACRHTQNGCDQCRNKYQQNRKCASFLFHGVPPPFRTSMR